MDFITGLPRTSRKHDAIMVFIDKLRKVAYFVEVKSTNSASELAQILIKEIVMFHGVPLYFLAEM